MIFNDDDKLTLGKKITMIAQWADEHDERERNGRQSGFTTIELSAQASRRPRGDTPIGLLMSKPFVVAKPPGHEFCSGCGVYRPTGYFYPDEDSATGYYKYCSGCCRGFAKQYYEAHKDAVKAKRRARYAAQAEAEGRTVRPYFRLQKAS